MNEENCVELTDETKPQIWHLNALSWVAPGNIQKTQLNFRPRVKGLWPCYSNKHMLLWNTTLAEPSVYLDYFIEYTDMMEKSAAFWHNGPAERAKVCNAASAHHWSSKKP